MALVLSIPQKLTYYNIQSVILNIESLDDDVVIFDLTRLDYVDPEGLNYIALMPFYLKNILRKSVIIDLPVIENTISYLHFTGLLNTYFIHFKIYRYNCLEDLMFLKQKFKRSNRQKARLGIITPNSFQSFLHNELANVEKLISSTEVSQHFCFSFYELVRNIFDHSGEDIGGFSFHYKNKYETTLELSITDIGKGIRSSMSSVYNNDSIYDFEFIEQALVEGVSCTGKFGRGLGLSKIANTIEFVQITSGNGQVITKEGQVYDRRTINTNLKGTSIFLKIRI